MTADGLRHTALPGLPRQPYPRLHRSAAAIILAGARRARHPAHSSTEIDLVVGSGRADGASELGGSYRSRRYCQVVGLALWHWRQGPHGLASLTRS